MSWYTKKICISFDWHNDRNYRHMLSAWIANPSFPFDFQDLTPGEINRSVRKPYPGSPAAHDIVQ